MRLSLAAVAMFTLVPSGAAAQAPCVAAPVAPAGFGSTVQGTSVTLRWQVSPGASRYYVRAGAAPGRREYGPFDVGSGTEVTLPAPPGTYFAVINAVNGCGAGPDSPEIVVHVGAPPAPGAFTVALPIAAEDVGRESFGLNAFGIHFGGTGASGHGLDGHPGWDIEYRVGGVIRAAADGVVQSLFADSYAAGRYTIQLMHRRGSLVFRTVYTNVVEPLGAIQAGAAVAAGQPIGFAGSQTLTIGTRPVTYAMTHFQVDDFRRNEGLTNPNAVNPQEYLDAGSLPLFNAIWQAAAYTVELTEPFPGNPRNIVFPFTRTWARESGSLAARIVFTRLAAASSAHDYVMFDERGALIEQGSVVMNVMREGTQIDLQPADGGGVRRGLIDIVSDTMRLSLGAPGGSRPVDLSAPTTYRTTR